MGEGQWAVNATPRPLDSGESPGKRCIGGMVGPRAGLDGCGTFIGIFHSFNPERVAIPTTLSRPTVCRRT